MFKWLVVVVALVGTGTFAQEVPVVGEDLVEVVSGDTALLLGDPQTALEHLQNAAQLVDRSSAGCDGTLFLILLGQTIAYDCLGLHEQCDQSLQDLRTLTANQPADEEDDDEESSDPEDVALEKVFTNMLDMCVFVLQNMVALAPSQDVRDALSGIVGDAVGAGLLSQELPAQ